MILYILIFASIVLFGLFDNYLLDDIDSLKLKKILTFLILVFLSLVSGTRLIGGSDYQFYLNSYKVVPTISKVISGVQINGTHYTASFDLGYLYLTSFLKSFGISFEIFTLIHSFFFNFAMYYGIKKYCNRFSAVLLVYICKLFFYNTFISMRQSITIAIFFLALPLIEKREFIKYLVICILCFFIHAGSAIMLPIYLINRIHLSKRKIVLFILILFPFALINMLHVDVISSVFHALGGLFSGTMVGGKLLNYSGGEGISPIYIVEFLIIVMMLLKNYDDIINIEHSDFIIKLFLILYIIFTILGGVSIITREKDYFILTYAIILNWLMMIKDNRLRNGIFIGLCLISGIEFFRYIIAFDGSSLLKYSSWLFNVFLS